MIDIDIQNLFFSYKPKQYVLENISLSIQHKDYIGIIGPNGGGKSSLLQLILGIYKPSSGSITIRKNHAQTPLDFGWVPQHFSFDKTFPISVEEVVLSGRLSKLKWHGMYNKSDYIATHQALDETDMLPYLKHCFSDLSGGQAQRVLLSRALVSNPQILLLDEPTSNIDPENQKLIFSKLQELNKTKTIIMITHDLHHTLKNFSKVVYLKTQLQILSKHDSSMEKFCCTTPLL